MATDIAQFLEENFLESLQQNEPSLSPAFTSLLNEIKREFTENSQFWSPPPDESLSCLYQLNHALIECRAYKRPLSLFSRLDQDLNDPKTVFNETKKRLLEIREKPKENEDSSSFTSSMFPIRKVSSYFSGFNDEISTIVKWLESNDGFKAIGIHGMCGTGKTTLVKMVMDDPRVREKYEPIWVDLSDLTASEEMDIRIVKEMLACLNDDPDQLTMEPKDDQLVEKLHGKLIEVHDQKKYLIVLDGVWHYNHWFSDLYVDKKGDGSKLLFSQALPKDTGGAVIITSRTKKVTKQLVGENLIHLKPWDKEKMKGFVKYCYHDRNWTEKMIEAIVYHCHGLPLVAATLSDWIHDQEDQQISHVPSGSETK